MLERVGLSEMREKERERVKESGQKENKFDDQRGEVTWKESRRVMSRLNLGPRAHEATCCYLCHYYSEMSV